MLKRLYNIILMLLQVAEAEKGWTAAVAEASHLEFCRSIATANVRPCPRVDHVDSTYTCIIICIIDVHIQLRWHKWVIWLAVG